LQLVTKNHKLRWLLCLRSEDNSMSNSVRVDRSNGLCEIYPLTVERVIHCIQVTLIYNRLLGARLLCRLLGSWSHRLEMRLLVQAHTIVEGWCHSLMLILQAALRYVSVHKWVLVLVFVRVKPINCSICDPWSEDISVVLGGTSWLWSRCYIWVFGNLTIGASLWVQL